jgi:hypothetical protein
LGGVRCLSPMLLGLALAVALVQGRAARAQEGVASAPETCGFQRFVVLEVNAEVDAELAAAVQRELATELARQGLGLCAALPSERDPAALVRLTVREGEAGIALDDRTTHKRVEREVKLGRIPAGGRPLAIAIAIDELLRASWAELTMLAHQAPQQTPPEARPLAPPERERDGPRTMLGAAVTTLNSSERLRAFGLSAQLEVFPIPALWLALSAGGLRALSVSRAPGEVVTTGASGTLAVGGCVAAGSRTELCIGPRGGVDYLVFRAEARPGATAQRGDGWLVRLEGVAAVHAALSSRLALAAQLGAGGALHGVNARGGASTLVGASGWLLSAQLGLKVEL